MLSINSGHQLTVLPLRVAHLQVTAGASGVLLGTLRAADVLNLLAQGLEGGVHFCVTVTYGVSIIGSVTTTVGIRGLLLGRLGNEAKVEPTTWSTRGARRSRKAGSTLNEKRGKDRGKRRSEIQPKFQSNAVTHRMWGIYTSFKPQQFSLTAGPISPARPRGPGGPMGPGRPFMPSLPTEPDEPAGP